MTIQVTIPDKLKPVFENLSTNRYSTIVLYGGRGGAKSEAIARAAVLESYVDDGVILCAREILKSIHDSLHASIKAKISELGLSADFEITNTQIRNLRTGAIFMFAGLRSNIGNIKSINNLRAVFVDEAENVSQKSWDFVRPTPRYGHTRLYVVFNPYLETDATWQEFVVRGKDDPRTLIIQVNYYDNPWFPESLENERQRALNGDIGKYRWIWLGEFLKISNKSIFGQKLKVEYFDIDESFGDTLIGVDWGFSVDPTCAVEVYERGRDIYIYRACSKVRLELDDTAMYLIHHVPNMLKYTSRADSARPETISKVRQQIPLMTACSKWTGSVEDGITKVQSYDNIYIHPDCPRSLFEELSGYSYKEDKDGNITAVPEDKSNHYADALRYALEPRIKRKSSYFFE